MSDAKTPRGVAAGVRPAREAGRHARAHAVALAILLPALLVAPRFLWQGARGGVATTAALSSEQVRARSADACRLLLPGVWPVEVRAVTALGGRENVWQAECVRPGDGIADGHGSTASHSKVHLTWDARTGALMDAASDPAAQEAGGATLDTARAAAATALRLAAGLQPLPPPGGWRLGRPPERIRRSWIVRLAGPAGETATFSLARDGGAVRFVRFARPEPTGGGPVVSRRLPGGSNRGL